MSKDGNVGFEFTAPVVGRRVWGLSAAVVADEVEIDPLGQEVGTYDPPPDSAGDVGRYPEPHEYGNADDPGAGCTIDGITSPCSVALRFLNSGAAQRCSNGNCGAQAVTVQALGANGRVLGAQTVWRFEGQAGWGGGLDGTYRVGAFRGGVLNVWNGAATSGFLDNLAGILHRFGDHNEYLYRVGGASDPPNPVSPEDVKAYRDRIAGMLKDGCSQFLNGLLDEAKAQTGKSYAGILATFDQIRFYWEDTGSSHGGFAYFEHGVLAASISNRIQTEKMGGSLANQRDRHAYLTSTTTDYFLGETLHHVGAGGAYTDGVMANALNAMLVRQGSDTPKVFSDKTMADIENASRYWHPKVWSACPAPRK